MWPRQGTVKLVEFKCTEGPNVQLDTLAICSKLFLGGFERAVEVDIENRTFSFYCDEDQVDTSVSVCKRALGDEQKCFDIEVT